MKNGKLIGAIGQALLVLGSAMYVFEMACLDTDLLLLPISCVYAVSLVLMFIGWLGTKDERRAAKQQAKEARKAREAA